MPSVAGYLALTSKEGDGHINVTQCVSMCVREL